MGCQRFGYRLIEFSVQGNHIHLVVEAPDVVALGRAMKGLEVRMARALNKVMKRKGPVFADRYHAFCSTTWKGHEPPLVAEPWWWMLRVGARRAMDRERELPPPLAA